MLISVSECMCFGAREISEDAFDGLPMYEGSVQGECQMSYSTGKSTCYTVFWSAVRIHGTERDQNEASSKKP